MTVGIGRTSSRVFEHNVRVDYEVHEDDPCAVGGASEVVMSREAGGALDVRSTPVILNVFVVAEGVRENREWGRLSTGDCSTRARPPALRRPPTAHLVRLPGRLSHAHPPIGRHFFRNHPEQAPLLSTRTTSSSSFHPSASHAFPAFSAFSRALFLSGVLFWSVPHDGLETQDPPLCVGGGAGDEDGTDAVAQDRLVHIVVLLSHGECFPSAWVLKLTADLY